MTNTVVTTSRVISFVEDLEDRSATFYRDLAQQFPEHRETFLSHASGCEKTRTSVVRTYRETISDALEAGFSFEGLELPAEELAPSLSEDASYAEALSAAIALEERAAEFYDDVARRSRSLLATIAMAFRSAAKDRKRRTKRLRTLLE